MRFLHVLFTELQDSGVRPARDPRVLALLKGRLVKSFLYHPLVPYSAAVYAGYVLEETRERLCRSRHRVPMSFWRGCVWLGLLILAGNTVARNLVLFCSQKQHIFLL